MGNHPLHQSSISLARYVLGGPDRYSAPARVPVLTTKRLSLSAPEWVKEIASSRRKKTAPDDSMRSLFAPWRRRAEVQQAGFPGLNADLLAPVLKARAGRHLRKPPLTSSPGAPER
jgi:hypothetical protein